jgi:hypothetical protein
MITTAVTQQIAQSHQAQQGMGQRLDEQTLGFMLVFAEESKKTLQMESLAIAYWECLCNGQELLNSATRDKFIEMDAAINALTETALEAYEQGELEKKRCDQELQNLRVNTENRLKALKNLDQQERKAIRGRITQAWNSVRQWAANGAMAARDNAIFSLRLRRQMQTHHKIQQHKLAIHMEQSSRRLKRGK